MRLLWLRDRQNLLVGDEVRVGAPSRDEELTLVIGVGNSVGVGDLHLDARGAEECLRNFLRARMRWYAFHADKGMVAKRPRRCRDQTRPPPPSQGESGGRRRRGAEDPFEVSPGGEANDEVVRPCPPHGDGVLRDVKMCLQIFQ